jgi:antibiotic biosynthesis monooxygenase (ABM) superfamily enzyme
MSASADHTRQPATVLVSRRVHDGEARQFRRWLRRLRRQIRRAPGFLDYRVHPPPTYNDNECVITYRFADAASLDRWLVSPQRLALIEESGALLTAAPVEQRVVEPRRDGVTLVSSVRVRPGADDAYQALHGQGVAAAQKLGGLLRSELIPPIPAAQDDTVAILTFADRPALDRWLASPERHSVLAAMSELTDGQRTLNMVGDFAGWFGGGSHRPSRRWKQAIVVIAGLIPVALLVTLAREALAPQLPLLAVVSVTAVCNVAALTWIVMPLLTAWLRPWLTR